MVFEMATLLLVALTLSGLSIAPSVLEAIGHRGAGATWWPVDDFALPERPKGSGA